MIMKRDKWQKLGFVDEKIEERTDLKAEIRRMSREKNAVILAHYYTKPEIQEVADFTGDSLALAQQAAKTNAAIIVMCGVHFMAETCKILCGEAKKVLCPDMNAGCSLADSCRADDLRQWKEEHPGYTVISYVNTTAEVKALSDIVVTSGNAVKVVDSFPKDERILFGPDYNLGSYINSVTGRKMLLWNGGCHVHERFSTEAIVELRKKHPQAKVLAHPECKGPVLALADMIGSTAKLLSYVSEHGDGGEYIIATEPGILHEMRRQCKDAIFLPVPPETSESGASCSCNECEFMKLNTLQKLYNSLKFECPVVEISPQLREKALKPILRMLQIK